jgi:ribosomal protein S18 acetylase RimI-like enzyme
MMESADSTQQIASGAEVLLWDAIAKGLARTKVDGGRLQLCESGSDQLWAPYKTPSAKLITLVHSATQRVLGYVIYEILDPVKDRQACFVACGSLDVLAAGYGAPTVHIAEVTVLPKYQKRGLGTLLMIAALCRGTAALAALSMPSTCALSAKVQEFKRAVDSAGAASTRESAVTMTVMVSSCPAVVDARSSYVQRILSRIGFNKYGSSAFGSKDVGTLLAKTENMQGIILAALHNLQESDYCLVRRVWRRWRATQDGGGVSIKNAEIKNGTSGVRLASSAAERESKRNV